MTEMTEAIMIQGLGKGSYYTIIRLYDNKLNIVNHTLTLIDFSHAGLIYSIDIIVYNSNHSCE